MVKQRFKAVLMDDQNLVRIVDETIDNLNCQTEAKASVFINTDFWVTVKSNLKKVSVLCNFSLKKITMKPLMI